MILHLLTDEKVCPRVIRLFEECNAHDNIFVVFKSKKEEWKFISKAENVLSCHSQEVKCIDWNRIDKVIVHYLDLAKIKFVLVHPLKGKTVIWMMWGADIYNDYLHRLGFPLYSPENSCQQIGRSNHLPLKYLRMLKFSVLSPYYFCLRKWFMENRVNYVVACDVEMELVKKYVRFKRLKSNLQFSYYSIEDVLGNLKSCRADGNKIIIGNSCSFSDNHEYVLERIKHLDLSSYEIVVPLNYGVNVEYKSIVSFKYRATLDNVTILDKFLPLDEYNRLMIQTCMYIYGNFRQEAWGNILIGLYLGGKVYLPKQNPLWEQCVQYGFTVNVLEDIQSTFKNKLSDNDKERNRMTALSLFSAEKNREYIQKICNL